MFSKMKAMGEGCGHGEKEQGLVLRGDGGGVGFVW